ncbi:phosphonate C-P lyase system protein PhnG [Sulfitobacter delicatus]|uniref:Alpha-D-ribose 1-methylphosphonate 5-triphosphate synthase subunit PhnG n=1 Tax=Sulfitobacter delicatus TaxID=218672 RepID=A0A1G7V1Y6_9RHOB|nr:phosphonate C-P lyase system protein PhnG [Sulfitobacter delicatus]SDG53379.1 alpha-D-ribose 1-methylphosphonate 5-triphosphate synthase subunit PhnG [Sulfitobacter delicatus]
MTVGPDEETRDRKKWMGLLARAEAGDLARLWQDLGRAPAHDVLRAPEIGGIMLRGRMGAVGDAFNIGEMSVTRCSVRLANGPDGHAYVQGRSRTKALQAALVDALMQSGAADAVRAKLLSPLAEIEAKRRASRAAKAAATKVDFFTMVRGED